MNAASNVKVPLSKKVLVGFFVAALGAVLPLVGLYHVPVYLQAIITAGEYGFASWIVKEERHYLEPALQNADK